MESETLDVTIKFTINLKTGMFTWTTNPRDLNDSELKLVYSCVAQTLRVSQAWDAPVPKEKQ